MTMNQWRNALLNDRTLNQSVKITGIAVSFLGGAYVPTPVELSHTRQLTPATIRKHMRQLRERGYAA